MSYSKLKLIKTKYSSLKIATFSCSLFCCLIVKAQYTFEESSNIEVVFNGSRLNDPFTGGFNTAQFAEIDINVDGIKDLAVYDRFLGQVRPYINRGISDSVSYYYAPEFSKLFPDMNEFLLSADYNNDGKMDLYIGGSTLLLYENISTNSTGLRFEFVEILESLYNSGSSTRIPVNPVPTNMPGLYDIDGDNDIDLFINQDFPTVNYHRNLSIDSNSNFNPLYERRSQCWGQFFEGPNEAGSIGDSIYIDSCYSFLNSGERKAYKGGLDQTNDKHLGSGGGLTITPFDYDGNGSTDLIVADAGARRLKVVLNSDSIAPYTESKIYKVLNSFPKDDIPVDLVFPATYLIDVNNDGKKDMLVATNQENVGIPPFSKDDVLYYENVATNGNFKFQFRSDRFLMDATLDFGRTSKPVFFDYNKDGLLDLLVGNGGYLSSISDSIFIAQLALIVNTGSPTIPKYDVIDLNYLNLPSLDFGSPDTSYANVSPTVGDIDNDGDEDLLITYSNGNVFLFEDTSSVSAEADFLFHQEPFQAIGNQNLYPTSTQLFDVNNNELLDLVVNSNSQVEFFPNFGTVFNPIFHISLDSIYWTGGDTMRYSFSETPNIALFQIGDSVEVNNALKRDNSDKIPLRIVTIDSINNFIECINLIDQGVGSNKFDEFNTTAKLTFYNRNWNFSKAGLDFSAENVFMYKDKGVNQVIIGASSGNNYSFRDFTDSLKSIDTMLNLRNNFMTNYGENSFIDGADINNDSIIDLVIGLNTGGIKILYGAKSVGLKETHSSKKQTDLFKLFPNPTNSSFTIKLHNEIQLKNSWLEIMDISGKLILKEPLKSNQVSFSTDKLSSGIYIVRIQNQNQFQVKRLIVQP